MVQCRLVMVVTFEGWLSGVFFSWSLPNYTNLIVFPANIIPYVFGRYVRSQLRQLHLDFVIATAFPTAQEPAWKRLEERSHGMQEFRFGLVWCGMGGLTGNENLRWLEKSH